MTDRPKNTVPFPYVPKPVESGNKRIAPQPDLTPLEQMYAYFSPERS